VRQAKKEFPDYSPKNAGRDNVYLNQPAEPIDPRDERAMELMHKRVKERALSLRWNLNGLMFIYAVLVIVIILSMQNINSVFVGLVAAAGLIGLWVYSTLRVNKLERQFYKQEISDYAGLLSPTTRYDSLENSFALGQIKASPLTRRELEIIKHMAGGKRNKDIARLLNLSESTVRNHISNVFNKLEVYDRMTVVLLAIRNGWIKHDSQKKYRQ